MLLNCDLGESPALFESGAQRELLRYLHLANVCCGAHAGSPELTRATFREAAAAQVRAGAHPGYPDPEHFGRRPLFGKQFNAAAVTDFVATQVAFARDAAREAGLELTHVKPHGALYNEAAADGEVAAAIARGVQLAAPGAVLIGLAGSVMLPVFRRQGFVIWREGFADRRYTEAGLLVPRSEPGAVLDDPALAIAQYAQLQRRCDTLCVHSDSPNAMAMLQALWPLTQGSDPPAAPPAQT